MYAQMLVGMVGTTGQWWLDARKPKEHVAAHLVNLAWNGLPAWRPSRRCRVPPPSPRADAASVTLGWSS